MGNCASCFGSRRRDSVYDEADEAQRFLDDPDTMNYGSFDDAAMNGQEDPLETLREIEALQRVVARTSDNMVDIYDLPFRIHAGEDEGTARYLSLMSKLSDREDRLPAAHIDWGTRGREGKGKNAARVKVEGVGALVGTFADAAAAMR